MKRKSRFFIGFVAATITFGSLVAFVGHRHHGGHHCHQQSYNHHNRCDEKSNQENNQNEKADSKENR